MATNQPNPVVWSWLVATLFGDSDDESEAGLADPFEDPEYFDALTTGNAFKLSCRSQPNESLECVLEAAARAAKTMPSLCSLAFTIHVNSCPRTDYEPGAFGFVYQKKGHTFKEEPLPCSENLWVGPREWKMSKSLEEGWKEVLGAEAEIQYRGW